VFGGALVEKIGLVRRAVQTPQESFPYSHYSHLDLCLLSLSKLSPTFFSDISSLDSSDPSALVSSDLERTLDSLLKLHRFLCGQYCVSIEDLRCVNASATEFIHKIGTFMTWSSFHHPFFGPKLRELSYTVITQILYNVNKSSDVFPAVLPSFLRCLFSPHKDVRSSALDHTAELFFFTKDTTTLALKLFTMTSSKQGGLLALTRVLNCILNFST